MATHKSWWSVRTVALILVTGVTVTVVAAAPTLARADPPTLPPDQRVDVRKDEEDRLAKQDKAYAKQLRELAKEYRETAKEVAKQGGDPTPLLQAANAIDGKHDRLFPGQP